MKKLFTLLATVTLSVMLFAQAPQSFSYQTVIRDASWQVLSNQTISLEISIIEDALNGTAIYTEFLQATTNELGLVNLSIGVVGGQVTSGSWSNIDWGNHTYFIQVAVDVTGGVNYIVMGTTQLRSVPYALYAETSGSSTPGPQGVQGIQGLPGDTGAVGPQGPIGLTGPAGSNGIDGTDGVDGAPGATGPQGPIGLTGPQGIQGPAGNDGADGQDGTDGTDGVDGAIGAQGPIGLTGPQGIQGPVGNDGADGNDGIDGVDGAVGATGPIGLTGATGPAGNDGGDGQDGADGATGPIGLTGATGPAGNDGADGTNGIDGAVGATGPIGLTGATGPAGNDGSDGTNGIDGAVGATGPIGLTGATGPAGANGIDGTNGVDGATGPQGNDGADGINGIDGAVGATGPPGVDGTNGTNGVDGYTPMFGVDYFNGQDGTNGVDGTNGADGIDAVVDYDSLANLISVDSTFITNVGGGMGGGGCDFRFPEGLDGVPITIGISSSQSYTVPSGQRFYILQKNDAFVLYKNGNQISNSQSYEFTQPLIINENDVITSGSGINIKHVSGILITNPDSNVQPITIEISSSQSYIVPSGQRLYLLNKGTGFGVYKNGNEVADGVSYFSIPIIFNENDIVNTVDIASVYASGYLVDENYFAGCGGGGSSSSTSSLDSTTIANMIAGAGGGCDFNYPEGVNGEGISTDVSQSNLYSVPTGKRLYLLNWQESSPVISGLSDYSNINGSSPLILNSGQSIYPEDANITSRMNGLLVPESNNLQGISTDVSQSNPYTVPLNKRLYLLSWVGSSPIINGLSDFISQTTGKPLILNSGQSVYPEDANTTSRMNGYLVDENYFAGCGGGGGSSTSSSLDSTTIANMIAAALPTPAAQIGEFRDGGVVFWVDGTGQHGLVCDIQELGLAEWGCEGFYANPNGTTIGSGAQNTIDILAACLTTGIAADLCANSTAQGYSDWFLPSKDALNQMYVNKTNVNFALLFNGGSAFSTTVNYWSSSHYNHDLAWRQNLFDGNQNYTLKSILFNVRAVRAF